MAIKNAAQKSLFWREHVDRFSASGSSRAAYCREHGLRDPQFKYYYDRLRNASGTGKQSPFVEVLAAPPVLTTSTPCAGRTARVILPAGVAIEIDATIEPSWIAKLIMEISVGSRR